MISILGFPVRLPSGFEFLGGPYFSFVATALTWLLIAILINFVFIRVLKWLFRNLAGEIEDIIFGIVRLPLVFLIVLFGVVNSLEILPLPPATIDWITRIANTLIVLVTIYVLWHIVKDILVHYGEKWARKTESQVDDIVIPILNLLGPLVILINGALIILPMWGVNIASVLVGAGIVGLVLGLALQDTLSNIFSGISLLIESAFRTGDLIVLGDGRTCQVERLGLRSTQLYSLDEHATVYVPNKTLSSSTLINISKPTVEQKLSIEVSVGRHVKIEQVQEALHRIALAHPSVVSTDIDAKITALRQRIDGNHQQSATQVDNDTVRSLLIDEAARYEQAIPKLQLEAKLNIQLKAFEASLRNLIRGIQERESKGLDLNELQELHCRYVSPTEEEISRLISCADERSFIQDPWVMESEYWDERKLWKHRNEQLRARWERIKRAITQPKDHQELRLDDLAKGLLDWLHQDYRLLPAPWKDPVVTFKGFGDSSINLQLWFYVDNVRLEHDSRAHRVKTEIARQIKEQFLQDNIWD